MDRRKEMQATILGVFAATDWDAAMERHFAPGYEAHSIAGDRQRGDVRGLMRALHDAFPDLEAEVDQMLVDGDRAAYSWVASGTHTGAFMGSPPTHRRATVRGVAISRFDAEGRIAEDWSSWNAESLMRSLGIFSLPARS